MKNTNKIYQMGYDYLVEYLDNLNLADSGKQILEAELKPFRSTNKVSSLVGANGIFYHMVMSLMNRQGFPNFIGWETIPESKDILLNYNAKKVYDRYNEDFQGLFNAFKHKFTDKTFNINKRRSAWYQFTTGVISIAKFLSNFDSYENFNKFVKSFSFNSYAVSALPMLLAQEIKGFGFALACDFLKESGYSDYGKPDVHLMDIFEGLSLINERSELETFRKIVDVAREADETPVVVDKVFWMIGSGKFEIYNRTHEDKIPVHKLKDDFVSKIKI